jgi:hypothetical protein
MMKHLWAAVAAALLCIAPAASAATIVDTGPGGASGSSYALYSGAWVAAEFSVTDPWQITDVQGWIDPFTGGELRVRLYSDGGAVPGSALQEGTVLIPGTGSTGWWGLSNLNWLIGAGSYWVAFEVAADSTFFGGMPFPSVNPTTNEASKLGEQGFWRAQDANFGVRVFGNQLAPVAVPEPASALLFGAGLLGIGLLGRRREQV